MTRRNRRSTFHSARWLLAAAVVAAVAAHAGPAAAQACCVGGALVSPVRLAPPDDYAVGLQTRVRGDMGSFGADGGYASASTEQDVEQDLAASFRITRRGQAGVVLPYVETRRIQSGGDSWGSGLGDISLNARYDFVYAAEGPGLWPGFGLLASVLFPTGKAAGDGTNPASTDATGTGTFNASLGIDLEKAHGPLYVALDAWVTYCGSRSVNTPAGNLTTTFPLQWTVLAIGGYVFENEAAVALYVNFLDRGDDAINGMNQPGTVLRLTTAGLTGIWPLTADWRLQGTVFSDLPIDSFGRNEQAGAGGTVTLVRAWR